MFPVEQSLLLNMVARKIMERSSILYEKSLSHLIDEVSLEKIAISTKGKNSGANS